MTDFASKTMLEPVYAGFFDREPDQDGLNFWARIAEKDGMKLVLAAFVDSEEYKARYERLSDPCVDIIRAFAADLHDGLQRYLATKAVSSSVFVRAWGEMANRAIADNAREDIGRVLKHLREHDYQRNASLPGFLNPVWSKHRRAMLAVGFSDADWPKTA